MLGIILLEILIIILFIVFVVLTVYLYGEYHEISGFFVMMIAIGLGIMIFLTPPIYDDLHGFINYDESNDRDKVRITAITQEQDIWKTFYRIEVEYLTNTPTQSGMVTNYNIEKDVFYCYKNDKVLVDKIKNNLYKELWLISGYKGGYEGKNFNFGDHLAKDIILIEEGE